MEEEYTNREIDHYMNDVKLTLKRIEEQTTKTNGRVTTLERWMWTVVGGLTLLSFLVGSKILALNG